MIAIDAPANPQKNAHLYRIFGPPKRKAAKKISDKSHICIGKISFQL